MVKTFLVLASTFSDGARLLLFYAGRQYFQRDRVLPTMYGALLQAVHYRL